MPPKKSVEELDAELAQLEAELAALEAGEGPKKPKKAKKPAPSPPPEAPDATDEAPKRRFGLPLPKRAAPADGEAPAPKKRFGFPLPGRRAAAAEPAEAQPPAPVEAPAALKDAPLPEPRVAWHGEGGAWRAQAPGAQRVEVLRRKLDERGQVVEEEDLGHETIAPPAPAPEPEAPRRFSLFGGRSEEPSPSPDGPPESGEAPPRRRRGLLIIPIVLIGLLLLLALVLPALGIDPLGIGDRLGTGSGGAPPDATFALDGNTVPIGGLVTLRAPCLATSGCPEYSWDFGDGSGDTGPSVTHAYASAGTFTVTLTARASGGRTATHAEDITVAAPPRALIALTLDGSPVAGENLPVASEELTFSGAGSSAQGGIATYDWTFGDGARGSGAEVTHAYAQPGSYRATLTVVDAGGLRGNTSVAVYVGQRTPTIAGSAPASVQGPQGVNETITVAQGGALPYRPVRLVATLTWNATGGGQVPGLPIPAPVATDNLVLNVYDASGALVASSANDGSPEEVVVTEFTGALGPWSIEVRRPQGGLQDLPYALEILLLNGPA